MATGYSLCVSCNIDGSQEDIYFDSIETVDVESTSDITEHPMVNGDIVADHMFNNPISVSVSGSFSIYGNKPYDFGNNNRLGNIQKLFERIKKEAILCTLTTINTSNKQQRFMTRNNMLLNSITWREKQSSMEFSFGFREVLLIELNEIEYDVDVTDENLPAVTNAPQANFTDELLDFSKVTEYVTKTLTDDGLIGEDFLNYTVKTIGAGLVTASVVSAVVGVAALSTICSICGGLAAAFPYGTIAAAVLAAAVFIAVGIKSVIQGLKKFKAQREFKLKAFKLYKDDLKSQKEVTRFCNYLGTVHQNLKVLDDSIQLYKITSDQPQVCSIYIDSNYYTFTFTKNNTDLTYSLKIETLTDLSNKEVFNKGNLTEFSKNCIYDCNSNNCMFRTEGSGFYVYLVNLKTKAAMETGESLDNIAKLQNDLTNYAVLVSQINLDNFNELLEKIVKNAMTV